jgi:hypothetical protein
MGRRGCFWYGLVVALVGVLLAVSQPTASAAASEPRAARCHPATWIHGLVENRTGTRILLAQEAIESTNQWCQTLEDEVRAHGTDEFRLGDEVGNTRVLLVYLLDNGDRVVFQAQVSKTAPTYVSCSYEVVQAPRTYECLAENVAGVDGHLAFVRFSVLPLRSGTSGR